MALDWEIDPADITLGGSGTVEQIVTAGPTFAGGTGDGPSLSTSGGYPVILLDAPAEGRTTLSAAARTLPASGALVLRARLAQAAIDETDGGGSGPLFDWAPQSPWDTMLSVWLGFAPARYDLLVSSPGKAFVQRPGLAITDTAWHTIVVTWSVASGVVIWLDGVASASTPYGDWSARTGPMTLHTRTTPRQDLMYAAVHSGTVTAASLFAEMDARFPAATLVELAGDGTVTITGAGSLLTTDVFDTPAPPAPSGIGGSQAPPALPVAQEPPTGVPAPVVRRKSEIMPAPALNAAGFPVDWSPTSVVEEAAGVFQVVVEDTDITYLLGAPVPTPSWSRADPFGPAKASIRLPQITAFHNIGVGDLAWCRGGANVTVLLGELVVFEGAIVSFGHDESGNEGRFTLTVLGCLYQADLQLRKPAFLTTPQDMGAAIASELNDVISRRYTTIPGAVTGIATSVRGGWEPKLTGRVQQMLATALTNGNQWTVTCVNRAPVLAVKDTTTVHWHVANGQRGVSIDLSQDWSQAPNAIYGEGIDPNGGRWRNSKYPNWRPDDTPAYPFANPATTITLGKTDAMTDTGNGVSLWQQRAGRPITGAFSSADRARLREMQAAYGIAVDGILGPQSWAASFATGSNTGTLDGAWIAPLAESLTVRPRLYAIDGADQGDNPDYDARVLRVERYLNFGEGVSKDEGRRASAELLARDMNPGWVGTITLTLDPEEGSRFEVLEGQNLAVRYWRGNTTLLLHVAAVDQSEERTTLTVDTNARDYPTLDAIRARERDAVDPARAYISPKGRSRLPQDMPTFDSEAGGGLVPRHALFGDLWTVIRIPVAHYGRIVRTDFQTSSATPFALAIFDRPITAAALLGLVGNPLTATSNPWNDEALDAAGLLMAWGWAKQPAGYWPGSYSDPDGEGATPPTGRLVDDASVEYASTQPPWLWVAEIAADSCYIEGRFYPGAD